MDFIDLFRRDGIAKSSVGFPQREVQQLYMHLLNCSVANHHVYALGTKTTIAEDAIGDESWPIMGHNEQDVLEAPNFLNYMERWRSVARQYFGSPAYFASTHAFWTQPASLHYGPTHDWHRDRCDGKQFTVFVYGTDVLLPDDGAHLYEEGSHLDADNGEDYNGYLPTRPVRVMTGHHGTTFAVDTFGIHMGLRPQRGPRLLLVARWSDKSK